jgi:LPXTG-site transpeptidase (sortase) family protein
MFKKAGSKYGDILTMLLIVLIVIILGIVGYFGYDIYTKNVKTSNAQTAMAEFEEATKSVRKKNTNTVGDEENTAVDVVETVERENVPEETTTSSTETTAKTEKVMYEGYEMVGTINIPKTNCEYPILAETTKHSIEVAVAILYGPGLNEPGNTVIVGHNYRNGLFFSNNKKLSIGDVIYITSATETVTYEIYNIYQTSPDDAEYMRRDTGGAREISLSTCTDDSSARLIIWAKEKV